MTVFDRYARYYDLLYRDKDYRGEAAFVDALVRQHGLAPDSILELGCGTGAHAVELARLGYKVSGIDFSSEMLTSAEARRKALPAELANMLTFAAGDIRNVRLGRRFSAVVSLFHVMSYQVTTQDLEAAFATAEQHLANGGVFVFDCWYGPAVLSLKPEVRVKRLEDDTIAVTRIAEPVMDVNANTVTVNFTVFVQDKATGVLQRIEECHRMRYLFMPEVRILAEKCGFQITLAREWMTEREPSLESWGVCFVGRRR